MAVMLLIEVLDKYASKGDVSIMMKSSGMPSNGSKRDMLALVKRHYNKMNAAPLLTRLPQAVLVNIVRNERTSAGLLSKMGLASKGELVNIILREIVQDETNSAIVTTLPKYSTSIPQPHLQQIVPATSQSSNPSMNPSRQKLFDLLMNLDKESIQSVLNRLGLAVSGNKNEIVIRLINSQDGNPQLIIPMIDLANLQYLASQFGVQRKRLKEEQVNEILSGCFGFSSITQQPQAPQSSPVGPNPKYTLTDDISRKLFEVMNKVDKDSLKTVLLRQDLPVSGRKEDLILRIMDANERSPKMVLNRLDGFSLQSIATTYDVPRRRSKEDQVNELMHMLFGFVKFEDIDRQHEDNKKMPIIPLFTGKNETPVQKTDNGFDTIIGEIELWIPSKSYSTEDGYRAELNMFLTGKGHHTRMDTGETLVDILVDQKYPIEVKKSPRGPDYDRAFGQIFRHLDAYRCVIVVVCSPKNMNELDDFRDRIRRTAEGLNHPYKLIIKG